MNLSVGSRIFLQTGLQQLTKLQTPTISQEHDVQ
jgi:hypothetical protein